MSISKYLWRKPFLLPAPYTYAIKVLNFQTLLYIILQIHPSFRCSSSISLKTFRCTNFVHDHRKHQSKFDQKSVKCVFIGYSSIQRGYKCYSHILHQMFASMDVIFLKTYHIFLRPHFRGIFEIKLSLGKCLSLNCLILHHPFYNHFLFLLYLKSRMYWVATC